MQLVDKLKLVTVYAMVRKPLQWLLAAFVIYSCCCATVFAQEAADSLKTKWSGIVVGVKFTPGISYRSYAGTPDVTQEYLDFYNEADKPGFGYTVGVELGYQSKGIFGFGTGLHFSSRGFNSRFVFGPPAGVATMVLMNERHFQQTLDVPLLLRAKIGKGKLRFSSSIGVIGSIFLFGDRTTTTTIIDPSGSLAYEYSPGTNEVHNVSPTISAGLDIELSPKLGVRIEPSFLYQIFSYSESDRLRGLWFTGLDLTLYFAKGH